MTRRQLGDAVAEYLPTDTAWTPAIIGSIERPGLDVPEDGRTRRVLARELLAFAWVLGVEPLWLAGYDGQDAQLDLGGEKPVTMRSPDGAFGALAEVRVQAARVVEAMSGLRQAEQMARDLTARASHVAELAGLVAGAIELADLDVDDVAGWAEQVGSA